MIYNKGKIKISLVKEFFLNLITKYKKSKIVRFKQILIKVFRVIKKAIKRNRILLIVKLKKSSRESKNQKKIYLHALIKFKKILVISRH